MKKVGVEIEFTGVKRVTVVRALERFFNSKAIAMVSKTTEDKYKYHKILDWNENAWYIY